MFLFDNGSSEAPAITKCESCGEGLAIIKCFTCAKLKKKKAKESSEEAFLRFCWECDTKKHKMLRLKENPHVTEMISFQEMFQENLNLISQVPSLKSSHSKLPDLNSESFNNTVSIPQTPEFNWGPINHNRSKSLGRPQSQKSSIQSPGNSTSFTQVNHFSLGIPANSVIQPKVVRTTYKDVNKPRSPSARKASPSRFTIERCYTDQDMPQSMGTRAIYRTPTRKSRSPSDSTFYNTLSELNSSVSKYSQHSANSKIIATPGANLKVRDYIGGVGTSQSFYPKQQRRDNFTTDSDINEYGAVVEATKLNRMIYNAHQQVSEERRVAHRLRQEIKLENERYAAAVASCKEELENLKSEQFFESKKLLTRIQRLELVLRRELASS